MKKLVIASDNKGKLKEFKELLKDLDVEVLTKAEAGFTDEVEENGTTFAENAKIKAETVCRATGLPAVADDSGLCVDALNGEPGLYSARYTGNHGDTDADRYNLLLKNMEGIENRSAHFVCSMCCCFPNGDTITSEHYLEGKILTEPHGTNNFGYDPVFQANGQNCSNGELSFEQKNAISHRGKCLKDFKEKWTQYYANI